MGIWRFAGAFAVVERQGEYGSKTAGMHVSQPMHLGACYGLGFYFILSFSTFMYLINILPPTDHSLFLVSNFSLFP